MFELERRVQKLERDNRRMRWALGLAALALLAACSQEPEPPTSITATEFKVVDEQGNVYASLGKLGWRPEGVLTLYDHQDGDRRTSLSPADLVLATGASSVHVQAGRVSILEMRDDQGWTGAKLSSHLDNRESSLWLTRGEASIYSSP